MVYWSQLCCVGFVSHRVRGLHGTFGWARSPHCYSCKTPCPQGLPERVRQVRLRDPADRAAHQNMEVGASSTGCGARPILNLIAWASSVK